MKIGQRLLRSTLTLVLAASLAACKWLSPTPQPQPPLAPAAQQAAAEKLAAAFAGACLSVADPTAATAALRTAGWPPFRTVWRQPDSVFYAAPPAPAGLFVLAERPWGGVAGAQQLTCVGHYPAQSAAPMIAAIARRWGAPRESQNPYPGALVWSFHTNAGAVTPTSSSEGLSPARAAALPPREADVYVQVFYNAALGDVASLIAVSRPTK